MEQVSVSVLSTTHQRAVKQNIILLLAGQLVSLVGSSMYSFAISLYILQVTGSALNFSISLALGTLPRVIFGPVSGVIADRFDRKKMVVGVDMLSGIVVLGLLCISAIDQLRIPYIYIATFLLSTCSIFFNTPLQASVRNLVDEKSLMRINSLSSSISSLSSIAGPFLGGLVFALIDIRLFLLFNGLSFVFSSISECFIDFDLREKIEGVPAKATQKGTFNFKKDMMEGLRYIKSQKWLMVLGTFVVLFNMLIMIGLTVPVPYIVRQVWGESAQKMGMINMMFPLGMVITSLVLAKMTPPEKMFRRLIISIGMFSVSILGVGLVTMGVLFKGSSEVNIALLMGLYLCMASASVMINLPVGITMQKLVPNEMMGRVQGTLGTLATALTPIGAILGGVLVDTMTPPFIPIICGVVMIGLTIKMAQVEELKDI